jgi:serine/threonine-protein kinase HipA
MNNKGDVYYQDSLAGYILETDEGYEFWYDSKYLAGPSPYPVSLTLPLTDEVYKNKTLFPFFDGLIPEGWLLDRAAVKWKIKTNDRFQLLLATCSDAIGAVSVIAAAQTPNN